MAVKYTRDSRRGDQKRDNTVGIICNQPRWEHSENAMYRDGLNHRQGFIEIKNSICLVRFSALPKTCAPFAINRAGTEFPSGAPKKRDHTVGIICNQPRREHSENVMYSDGIDYRARDI